MLSKKGRSAEERGQKKTSNPPLVSRSKALQQEPEAPSSPPKKARQSRDERQFDKDTDQALRESIATTVCQQSTEPAPSRPGVEDGTVHTLQLIIHTHILLLTLLQVRTVITSPSMKRKMMTIPVDMMRRLTVILKHLDLLLQRSPNPQRRRV